MDILLLRHGHAGSKSTWHGNDSLRPLSAGGEAAASALVDVLSEFEPERIVSSPLLRCRQTVEPVAVHMGINIETNDKLLPDSDKQAISLIRRLAKTTKSNVIVVCTHGEVIEKIQKALGAKEAISFGDDMARDKASIWVLRTTDGRITSAEYVPPPPVVLLRSELSG
jgi:phosphohistidine phosphatase SixA